MEGFRKTDGKGERSPIVVSPVVKKRGDEHPSFFDRLITAILAPMAFNFSLITVVAMFSSPRGPALLNPYQLLYEISGYLLLLVCVVLPSIAGFSMGMSSFTRFLGHFFYTNIGDEKDIRKTIAAWGCLFLITYCIAEALA